MLIVASLSTGIWRFDKELTVGPKSMQTFSVATLLNFPQTLLREFIMRLVGALLVLYSPWLGCFIFAAIISGASLLPAALQPGNSKSSTSMIPKRRRRPSRLQFRGNGSGTGHLFDASRRGRPTHASAVTPVRTTEPFLAAGWTKWNLTGDDHTWNLIKIYHGLV